MLVVWYIITLSKRQGTHKRRLKAMKSINEMIKARVKNEIADMFKRVRINSIEPTICEYSEGLHIIRVYKLNVSCTRLYSEKVIRADIFFHADIDMMSEKNYKMKLDADNLWDMMIA